MAKNYKVPKYRPRAWLWWVALFIAGIGGGYYYYLTNRFDDPSSLHQDQLYAKIIALVTILSVLICVIAATAQLWFKR